MSVLNTGLATPSRGSFTLDQSLRFNDDDDAKLSRTPSSAGNRKTWTLSVWIKRGNLGSEQGILTGKIANDDTHTFKIASSDQISIFSRISGANTKEYYGVSRLRDTGAWYHIVFAFDTTQSTEADRVKVWINGVAESFTGVTAFPEDYEPYINSTVEHNIGNFQDSSTSLDFDGYLAEMHFIDGTALTPASFGETGDYGEWKPIEVSGLTYGTNGFYLSFAGGGVMSATGGTITTDGDYKVHSFTADGTFTPTSISNGGEVEYLVIAGGGSGGGGNYFAGGGGAGGFRTGYLAVTEQAYSITVGAGGAGGSTGTSNNGSNSVFSSITSIGGGGGGLYNTQAGKVGGSGGGGAGYDNEYRLSGAGTAGQGYAGGNGHGASIEYSGGGGGGASAVGGAGTSSAGGAGGAGLASSITGSSVTYAGGGGGSGNPPGTAGAGGAGGGGAGSTGAATNGTANTGGGGGGAEREGAATSGAGGSGIVIIRYKFQ